MDQLYVELPDGIYCPLREKDNSRCSIAPIICIGKLKDRPSVCPIKVKPDNHFPCSASIDLVLQAIDCLKNVIEKDVK